MFRVAWVTDKGTAISFAAAFSNSNYSPRNPTNDPWKQDFLARLVFV